MKLLNGRSDGRDSGGRRVVLPPKFIRAAPEKPDGLTENEVWLWDQTVPELERLDLLKEADIGVLRGYLMMWDQAHIAHAASQRYGALIPVKTSTGTAVQANPAMRETRLAVAELRKLAVELGCTPVAERAIADLDEPSGDEGSPFGPKRPYPFNGYYG